MKVRNGRSFLGSFLSLVAGVFVTASVYGQTPSPTPTPAVGGPPSIFTTYDGQTLKKGEYTFSSAWSNFHPEVQTFRMTSKLLAREIPYRIVLPPKYDSSPASATRFPVVYLLHGLTGHFDNWTEKAKLAEHAAQFRVIIVTPEGGDGWYTDSATVPNDKYESYIIQELIPEIDGKFRTIADRDHRAIAGLSMGGYGAIKFGLKYPQLFSLIGSFSGALDAPLRGQNHKFLRPSIMSVFGSDNSQIRKDNDIFRLVREMTAEKLKRLPFLYLDCGTEDTTNFQNNRDFAALLLEKKVPHEFRELPGEHNWTYWDQQVQEFLRISSRRFGKQ